MRSISVVQSKADAMSDSGIHMLLAEHNARELEAAPGHYGEWMRLNCVIDPRDEIFHFFAKHPLAKNPIREYLADGWRTLAELMLLLEKVEQPLAQCSHFLEFAAGFGRFTRHLAKAIPGRVTVSEVQAGAVEFAVSNFGVEGFTSSHIPEALRYPRQYAVVFVLSMFTHLPPVMWARWLRSLLRGVAPGGVLVFSVHNEDYARAQGVEFAADGTCFMASSESTSLDGLVYGTTFTTRAYTENAVKQALGKACLHYETHAFWVGQDAVVIQA